jgi:two-component system sensor histidine kinase DesK
MQLATPSPVPRAPNLPFAVLWSAWLFWLVFCVPPLVQAWQALPSAIGVVQFVTTLAFVGLYAASTWDNTRALRDPVVRRAPSRVWWAAQGVMLAISVFALAHNGANAAGLFIYSSANSAGRLPPRQALRFVGLVELLLVLLCWRTGADPATTLQMLILVPAVGITTGSMAWAITTNRELHAARQEIARLAVGEERLRFARDLHDLLGHTLSLIAIKSELARHLVAEAPAQAESEIGDIEAAARTALSEVREAVVGYRRADLAGELHNAQEVLAAAGVGCTIAGAITALTAPTEALFAWVVREGITNVLRHSHAHHCQITFTNEHGAAGMIIHDDGRGAAGAAVNAGNGLRGLAERAATWGADFSAGPDPMGGFRLAVSLPHAGEGGVPTPPQQRSGVA